MGVVFWFTGLPCSGKTTLAKKLEKYFKDKRMPVKVLDGDTLRKSSSQDLGFSKKDRDENIRRATHLAKDLSRKGTNIIASFVSPYNEMRLYARENCQNFVEIYVKCSIEKCIERDVKGLYKKALRGEIKDFTGIQDPYEEPLNPELTLETDKHPSEFLIKKIINFIEK